MISIGSTHKKNQKNLGKYTVHIVLIIYDILVRSDGKQNTAEVGARGALELSLVLANRLNRSGLLFCNIIGSYYF